MNCDRKIGTYGSACAKLVPVAVLTSLTTHVLVLLKRLDVPSTALSTTFSNCITFLVSHLIGRIHRRFAVFNSFDSTLFTNVLLARPNKLFFVNLHDQDSRYEAFQ